MGAYNGTGGNYVEVLAGNSGSFTEYFKIGSSPYVSLQITKLTTGTIDSLRIETSNVHDGLNQPLTQSNMNGHWYQEPGEHSSSLLFTSSSATPSSRMAHFGNINARYMRVIANTGHGDIFRISLHGKD